MKEIRSKYINVNQKWGFGMAIFTYMFKYLDDLLSIDSTNLDALSIEFTQHQSNKLNIFDTESPILNLY